jgi:hypothetical protein
MAPWTTRMAMSISRALTAAIIEAMIGPQRSFFGGQPGEYLILLTSRGREV